ncbi:MAG: RdgB/HAM1 family non-canonical purine NTP pyrophosphatase [Clostridiales bacterium]|jgi:XTP/dITP diphosphohydrolase|nr:RdgB/HAM1 family non-canonical purine NTP pyrophosphatase [Clostridiales bacterium]
MISIVLATKNPGKLKEMKDILEEWGYTVQSMAEAGVELDVLEDGDTYEENALKKASEVSRALKRAGCRILTLADDSGLEVNALSGEPGVYSSRFLGADTPHVIKNQKILDLLWDVPKENRTARFVCVVAAVFPDGRTLTARAAVEGRIAHDVRGAEGFGFDPIFDLPEYDQTMAEIPALLKNKISHRAKALQQLMEALPAGGLE